jgi:hypothetical protein
MSTMAITIDTSIPALIRNCKIPLSVAFGQGMTDRRAREYGRCRRDSSEIREAGRRPVAVDEH